MIRFCLIMLVLIVGMLHQKARAEARKLRVCVGDFPSYAIGLDYLRQQKDRYEVIQSTVYAFSVRFKKNFFDLIMADSFIFVANEHEAADTRIVSLVNYSDGIDQVIGQKEPLPHDLRGSHWALQRETVSTVLLHFYLKSLGLSLRDVNLEDVKVENTPQAIGKTRFAGIVSWQPYARQAVNRGGRVLATSADYKERLYDFVVTRRAALDEHRVAIQDYLRERLKRAKAREIPRERKAEDFQGLFIFEDATSVRHEEAKVMQSLRISAEVADITQSSATRVQDGLKHREATVFDFSLLE